MATPALKAAYIEKHVSADLQYLWSDSGVDDDTQYELAQRYQNVRRFSSMDDDRADLKKALKDELAYEGELRNHSKSLGPTVAFLSAAGYLKES